MTMPPTPPTPPTPPKTKAQRRTMHVGMTGRLSLKRVPHHGFETRRPSANSLRFLLKAARHEGVTPLIQREGEKTADDVEVDGQAIGGSDARVDATRPARRRDWMHRIAFLP